MITGPSERFARLSPSQQALLLRKLEDRPRERLASIPRAAGDTRRCLSYGQERMWLLWKLTGESRAYQVCTGVRLRGVLDIRALELAVEEITRRHEILRTTYATEGDRPVQVFNAPSRVSVASIEVGAGWIDARDEPLVVEQRIAADLARPFNLETGPVLRVAVVRQREDEHLLLFAIHHIAFDAWSAGLLIGEFAALYEAIVLGRAPVLPELPNQYADFGAWQREWLRSAAAQEQLAYWRHQLAGSAILDLPTDRPRPPVQTHRGTDALFPLSRGLNDALERIARQESVTPFMVLVAGFDVLLARYTGLEDIAVGTPIANRSRPELEGMIGFLLNTLVLRVDVAGNPTFRELLHRVRRVVLEAQSKQDVPFEWIVDAVRPARDLSRTPLFQVMFASEATPTMRPVTLRGLQVEPVEIPGHAALFDLTLQAERRGRELAIRANYNVDLFDAPTIAAMVRHFETVLTHVTADPDLRLRDVPLLTPEESHCILVQWNQTAIQEPVGARAHGLFAAQVVDTPDAIALVRGAEQWTYARLDRRADRLADELRSRGVGPDVVVAVCLERSPEQVISLLAILKAGGAFQPIDPAFPMERIGRLLAASGARIVVATRSSTSRLPTSASCELLLLDEPGHDGPYAGARKPFVRVDGGNLAYVLFTSGSTGEPKGVAVTHRALANQLAWMQATFPLQSRDRVLQKTALSFDVSVSEILAPLISGAALILAPPASEVDPPALLRAVDDHEITRLYLVPSALRYLVEEPGLGGAMTLRQVLCAGEALSGALAARLADRHSAQLINLYGPTEATIYATFCSGSPRPSREWIPIGRPIANTRAYVLDRDLAPVPLGVTGELYLAGEGLARGYLHWPELTAASFLPDPYSTRGERLYRTGDLARSDRRGALEFVGRVDRQVKLRGIRIEPGEIESALASHPAVQAVSVQALDASPGDRYLAAYVVMREGSAPSIPLIADYLRQRLPETLVPTKWVFLDALPLTTGGKVDRARLPAPDGSTGRVHFAPPRSELERAIAGIWSEVLGLERVGIHENFFDLGGHSLALVRVHARLRRLFDPGLSIIELFRHPTVSSLAQRLQSLPRTGPDPSGVEERARMQRAAIERRRSAGGWRHET